jgi:hypothetical protein
MTRYTRFFNVPAAQRAVKKVPLAAQLNHLEPGDEEVATLPEENI